MTSRNRWIAVLAATLGLAAGISVSLLDDRDPSPAPEARPTPEPTASLDSDEALRDLRRQLRRLEQQQIDLASTTQPAAAETEDEVPAAEAGDEPPPMTDREIADALAWHLEGQSRDAAWAGLAERTLADAVQRSFADAAVEAVDCRATFCRLELSYADAEARATFAREAPTVAAFATQGFLVFEGDEDAPRSVLYVAREGESLPVI